MHDTHHILFKLTTKIAFVAIDKHTLSYLKVQLM